MRRGALCWMWCAARREARFMPLTVGGGIRTLEDIRALLLAGASKLSINTTAVERPEFVREAAEESGSQCIVAAIDAKQGTHAHNGPPFEVFTHGGRRATGIDAVAHARKLVDYGAGEILLTSMDRDGTKSGYNIPLTRAVSDAVHVPVIASGGVGSVDDLVKGVTEGHADARAGGVDLPFRRSQHRGCQSGDGQSRTSRARGITRALHRAGLT